MKKRFTKFVSLFLILVLMAALFSMCSSVKKEGDIIRPSSISAVQTNQPLPETSEAKIYPLDTDVTIKYWMPLSKLVASLANSYADVPFYQELMKRTGIKIEYISCAADQYKEAFNILVASRDLPDIVEYSIRDLYPGGAVKAISDGVIISHNEVFEKYSPNLKSYLAAHPEIDKQVKTDDGTYYGYLTFSSAEALTNGGGIIRKDWLDDLGLDIPETIDDWYIMLKAFKEKKNAKAPLIINGGSDAVRLAFLFESAFNVSLSYYNTAFYRENGKVRFGSMEPGYKAFLETMAKWYREGLVDPNFSVADGITVDAYMLNGDCGATYGTPTDISKYLDLMKEKNPEYNLTGAKNPVLKKGDRAVVGIANHQANSGSMAAITTGCENPEIAARLLDYGYSPEGLMLFNFGIEGKSYTIVNDEPVYTGLIMSNPVGLSMKEALLKYSRGCSYCPSIQDIRVTNQLYKYQQQIDAMLLYNDNDKLAAFMPPVSLADEESEEYAQIMTDVETLVKEMRFKYIMGVVPLSTFDDYVNELKMMNIDRAIEIKQQAYDRYMSR